MSGKVELPGYSLAGLFIEDAEQFTLVECEAMARIW